MDVIVKIRNYALKERWLEPDDEKCVERIALHWPYSHMAAKKWFFWLCAHHPHFKAKTPFEFFPGNEGSEDE